MLWVQIPSLAPVRQDEEFEFPQGFMISKVAVKDISSCEKLITIHVAPDQIKQEYNVFYAKAEKVAKVPGFRPGKVPRDILAIHYKDTAREEVLKNLIPKSLAEACRSKDIHPISTPTVQRIDFEQDHFNFDAHVEVRPKIKIDRYKGLTVKPKPLQVQDSEVSDIMKRIQESHAKFVPIENREAVIGDYLICDYVCNVGGKQIEKRSEDMIALKEKDYLEGFSNQLVGVKSGDKRDVKVIFPQNYTNKKFAGKEGIFQVSVKEIKTRELPAIDDEFAKEAGDFQTVNDLTQKIRTDIETHKKEEQNLEIENALLDLLIQNSKFDVPKRMVERRRNALVEDTIHRLKHQGLNREADAQELETLRQKMQPEAERQVKISFILDEVAQKEKIEAQAADFSAKYETIAKQYRKPFEEIQEHFEKNQNEKESLLLRIVSEKTIQFVKDHAVIKTA
ncbi:MAG: trigger factor [Candidatus Omnitrophica bacterium]|nr:trigger factor [Candidatus Omnitrophota bacterium]